jgi:hypothetical protein
LGTHKHVILEIRCKYTKYSAKHDAVFAEIVIIRREIAKGSGGLLLKKGRDETGKAACVITTDAAG